MFTGRSGLSRAERSMGSWLRRALIRQFILSGVNRRYKILGKSSRRRLERVGKQPNPARMEPHP